MTRHHRNIHPSHTAVVARLEEKYAHLGVRFYQGFAGSVPVQAYGRIGRRFFYFRFRGDCASLTIGSPDRRGDAARYKAQRVKALRTLRRKDDSGFFGLYGALRDLRRGTGQEWYPSIPVRYAVINDVTGERYAGCLEQDEAEALFVRLMEDLGPARKQTRVGRHYRLIARGQRSWPMNSSGVIQKPSKRRP
ncbi:hypothetical protein [Pseudarthrobacter sp. BIM B-2242]|uniref:hypothetical protein n=1 Tax=Pseudarthrobacter sp. BIM B-2242 TaxID=2772401 RepID=UPI00168BA457|nr:hypothetical protein [Pseudarthrobacter sp. BIM B-2242]QOD05662.1 hypothetical protein IDT60_21710 [Pseudarthrobacter sp. BIM B-2242]